MRHFLVAVLVFFQCFPVSVCFANVPNSSQWVGLNRIGNWKADQDAAYPELIRRIRNWAENIDSINVQVVIGSRSVSENELVIEKLRSELSEATEKLQLQLINGKDSPPKKNLIHSMIELRRRASGISELGPPIQKSLLVEAAYHWSEGNISLARTMAERAIKIHPEGQIFSLEQGESSVIGHFNFDAFDSFISQVKSKQMRNCMVRTDIYPVSARVKVNGFGVVNPKEFLLASEGSHHLEITAMGFEPKKELISCKSLETKKLKLSLRPNREASAFSKNESIKVGDLKSMLLIEPTEDRFKLFLYTPGTAIDELPLKYPIKLAELGAQADSGDVPIATDAAVNLFEKHRLLAANLQVDKLENNGPLSSFGAEIREESRGKSWLESPVFWGIVGGVLLGGAITYFATQNKGPSTTTSDWN